MLCNGFVRSLIEYWTQVWPPNKRKINNKLDAMQHREPSTIFVFENKLQE